MNVLSSVSVRTRAELLLGALVLVALSVQTARLNGEQRHAATLALASDTLRATRDTTRRLVLALNVLAAGTQAVQRQVVQTEQRNDSLDRALKLERISKTQLAVVINDLRAQSTAVVHVANATDSATRTATFTGREAPYTYRDSVALPAPPHTATHVLSVSLDSIALEVRLGCSRANADGIRSAEATLTGPTWARLSLNRVEQSPDLCQSPALTPAHGDGRSWFWRTLGRVGLTADYGVTASRDPDRPGRLVFTTGPQLGVGVKLWP